MKVLVFPADDGTPYQALLYTELRRRGARVSYLGRLTPSRTLNLALLPLELAVHRAAGARIVHLHWVFGFGLPVLRLPGGCGALASPRAAEAWFGLCLTVIRLIGLRLVWTAHNALPHAPVFADDARARRRLVAAADLVIAHSPAALAELASIGAVPRRSAVIPHGPILPPEGSGPARQPGGGDGPRQFLFFGKVAPYKGVAELLTAFAALPAATPARLTVAGECGDPGLRRELRTLAGSCGGRARLCLDRVPDAEVPGLLSSADVVVLPFRRVTTSGSVILALSHGRPTVIPALPSLADLPGAAVARYDGSVAGLTATLARLAAVPAAELAAMSAAAQAHTAATSWADVAAATWSEFTALAGKPRRVREPAQAG